MSKYVKNISRDGTSQEKRFINALNPGYTQIDDRTLEDWFKIVGSVAEQISYYNDNDVRDGDWRQFFPAETDIKVILSKLGRITNIPSHITLFIVFLKLLSTAKSDINKITGKFLQYYYEKVLQFKTEPPAPYKVHVLFELAKQVNDPVKIESGSRLTAGKDISGNDIFFETKRDLIVNKASIDSLKNVFIDFSDEHRIYASPIANSMDGLGKPLTKEVQFWGPFGESQKGKSPGERSMPYAEVGFGIASPILLLRDGVRDIYITLTVASYSLTESNIKKLELDGLPSEVIQRISTIKDQSFESLILLEEFIRSQLDDAQVTAYLNQILNETNNPLRHLNIAKLNKAFSVKYSSGQGWHYLENAKISCAKSGENILVFSVHLDKNDPEIVTLPVNGSTGNILGSNPAVIFYLNQSNRPFLYEELRSLKLTKAYISVKVNGARDLVLQNDVGPIDSSKPFLPFGPSPSPGSNFYFGSDEVFSKKLDSLSINISWADLPDPIQFPDGFEDYYLEYGLGLNNDVFKAEFNVLKDYKWIKPDSNELVSLFAEISFDSKILETEIFTRDLYLPVSFNPGFEYSDNDSLSINNKRGFGRLTLIAPDFGHSIFANKYASIIIRKATLPAHINDNLPNKPYTLKMGHFSLNYSSSIIYDFSIKTSEGHVFHVEPFGNNDRPGSTPFLIPQFNWGTLYFGVKDLKPPQRLSMLIRFLEGSADPDVRATRNDVKWSYLAGNKWVPVGESELQAETTYGFQTTGIIDLTIGRDASSMHNVLPINLHWLRASIDKDPSGVCKMVDFFSQAITAEMVDNPNTTQDFSGPIQENTIKKLENKILGIKSVKQPYASFGGKVRESVNNSHRRISERLHHKQRAVSIWDFEHMTLEAFPSIYKVKGLPHTNFNLGTCPGDLTLVVIPDLKKHRALNRLQPKVSVVEREKIQLYLSKFKSLFNEVHIANPKYEPILVRMKIGLKPGYDGGYYGKLLNEDIKRYLSPWAFQEGRDIVFGGKIYKSSILSYIEGLPYIDYITDFKIFQLNRGLGIGDMRIETDFIVRPDTLGDEMEIAEASSEGSILVSAEEHEITVLNAGEFLCSGPDSGTGIGYMAIEVDFIVD